MKGSPMPKKTGAEDPYGYDAGTDSIRVGRHAWSGCCWSSARW